MRPFRIDIPEREIEDLHRRLAATRWPAEHEDVGWSRGTSLSWCKDVAEYWRTTYDWRAQEARLNELPQFTTDIDGANVHFFHVRSPHADATPLILTHGWPSSPVEFLQIVEPLTNPVDGPAFHLVIPSIPGFGLSGPLATTGWDAERVARAWAELMRALGYDRYLAAGGDWGMMISFLLARQQPEHVIGVHTNTLVTFPPADPAAMGEITPKEGAALAGLMHFDAELSGYFKLHASRPRSLGYALTDSPVGQLAWIAERFMDWTDAEKSPEDAVDRDALLTNVMLYWLTATANSAADLYYETTDRTNPMVVAKWGGPWLITMPAAVAVFAGDPAQPIRRFADQALPTILQWNEYDRGGHFAAMEEPDLYAEDLREFARALGRAA